MMPPKWKRAAPARATRGNATTQIHEHTTSRRDDQPRPFIVFYKKHSGAWREYGRFVQRDEADRVRGLLANGGFIRDSGRVAGAAGYATTDLPAGTMIAGVWQYIPWGCLDRALNSLSIPTIRPALRPESSRLAAWCPATWPCAIRPRSMPRQAFRDPNPRQASEVRIARRGPTPAGWAYICGTTRSALGNHYPSLLLFDGDRETINARRPTSRRGQG